MMTTETHEIRPGTAEQAPSSSAIRLLTVAEMAAAGGAGLLLPAIQAAREAARR